MTVSSATASESNSRFLTSSPVIPLLTLGVWVYLMALTIWQAALPSDGWLIEQDVETGRVTFTQPITESPSPLQAGDELLAIEAYTIQQMDAALYTFHPPQSDNVAAGRVARYTIRRAERELTVAVPLRRLTLTEIGRQLFGSGLANLPRVDFVFMGVVALIVFVKQPRHRAAQLLLMSGAALTALATQMFSVGVTINFSYLPVLGVLINPWPMFVHAPLAHLLLIFPEENPLLRRSPRVFLALVYLTVPVISAATLAVYSISGLIPVALLNVIGGLIILAFPLLVMLPSLAYTLRTAHAPMTRAQAKWVGVGILGLIVLGNIGWIVPAAGGSDWFWVLSIVGYAQLPVCLGIAILRYRLWDIDLLVRRTLQYTLLSSLLALTYFGLITLSQGVLRTVSPRQSDLGVVVSTLAIAALFFPLRQRVQMFIDKRFYRQKYDAQRVLAEFAATCRDETDIEQLAARLADAVQETMQPTSASVWLTQAATEGRRATGLGAGGEKEH